MISYNEELYHHGVKGMRWGVRRFRRQQKKQSDKRLNLHIKEGRLERRIERRNKRKGQYAKTAAKYSVAGLLSLGVAQYDKSSRMSPKTLGLVSLGTVAGSAALAGGQKLVDNVRNKADSRKLSSVKAEIEAMKKRKG